MAVRPRIQRAFLAWLAKVEGRSAVPLFVQKRTDRLIEIGLGKFEPHLVAYLKRGGIDVAVDWDGACWDFLWDEITAPLNVTGGYACGAWGCTEPSVFSTREAYWREHLFEPFLDWLNDKLAAAQALGLYRVDGCTWAKLLFEEEDNERGSRVAVIKD